MRNLSKSLTASLLSCLLVLVLCDWTDAEAESYPRNASSCEQCHAIPAKFGSTRLTVFRVGRRMAGTFVPGPEGGIQHRQGSSSAVPVTADQITGERVSLSLLGDGYMEAIDDRDLQQNAAEQRRAVVDDDEEPPD